MSAFIKAFVVCFVVFFRKIVPVITILSSSVGFCEVFFYCCENFFLPNSPVIGFGITLCVCRFRSSMQLNFLGCSPVRVCCCCFFRYFCFCFQNRRLLLCVSSVCSLSLRLQFYLRKSFYDARVCALCSLNSSNSYSNRPSSLATATLLLKTLRAGDM